MVSQEFFFSAGVLLGLIGGVSGNFMVTSLYRLHSFQENNPNMCSFQLIASKKYDFVLFISNFIFLIAVILFFIPYIQNPG